MSCPIKGSSKSHLLNIESYSKQGITCSKNTQTLCTYTKIKTKKGDVCPPGTTNTPYNMDDGRVETSCSLITLNKVDVTPQVNGKCGFNL